jgi:hypothetical protein
MKADFFVHLCGIGLNEIQARNNGHLCILTNPRGEAWTTEEIKQLALELKPKTVVHHSAARSDKIVVDGYYSSIDISLALGRGGFLQHVVQGYDNPSLPFPITEFGKGDQACLPDDRPKPATPETAA